MQDTIDDTMPTVATEAMKKAALQREIVMRKRAYPGFVRSGRMTQRQADREIWILEQVLERGFRPELAW